jgi:hypothetical protein
MKAPSWNTHGLHGHADMLAMIPSMCGEAAYQYAQHHTVPVVLQTWSYGTGGASGACYAAVGGNML